ncbi:N-acetylmuramoyl-L-alanine amidase [Candidatus Enterococcus clewellii]|uniref:N-acetylmuramoyl-L-alanine amidase n=1 Tax=Candidatus Enterococcus clewellii TaxID=1834193 RepID=A0A242K409_9ENTE|nr:N-acetylmuramoyl-L-alanine amidase [Enterococcus sp. 9E7_DIV0242]OTP13728.1 hypothetical protein A5888_003207 [Enterococcus sp. 9E7_DIV0242]
MVKILLIAGHGAGDPGAVGCGLQEAVETRDVVNRLAPLLRNKGADVTVLNQSIDAFASIQRGSVPFSNGYDYVFEVHFNAAGATAQGTEIFVTNAESATDVEQKIMSKISKFFVNRGVKRTDFSVIWTAKSMGMSSALLEVCFISSKEDIAVYSANRQAIAQAICDGIAEGFGLSSSSTNTSNNDTTNKIEVKLEELNMECIIQKGKSQYYFDGTSIKGLANPDEARAIGTVYKTINNKNITVVIVTDAQFTSLKNLTKRKAL